MKVYLVGIKGVAMSALAIILKKMGYEVFGSDVEEIFITDEELHKNNLIPDVGFDASKINKDLSFLIYSGANKGINNLQVQKAIEQGIKIYTQAEYIGKLIKEFEISIAITGSHGKTTTSSLLAYCLIKLGGSPSYMIGSSSFNNFLGGDFISKKYFVFEADEYAVDPPRDNTIKLEHYHPDYSVITNIDFDHPDVYRNINHVKEIFLKFINNSKNVFLCIDDLNSRDLITKINKKVITFGYSEEADFQIYQSKSLITGSRFLIKSKDKELGEFITNLYGKKNISNIAGVIALLSSLGFELEKLKEVIKGFKGAKRRFELIFDSNGILLYDDYAHHPSEIESTLNTAKEIFKNRRIVVIFQSHTFSRTQKFLKEFAISLSIADVIYVMPIFSSARENKEDFNVSAQSIVDIAEKHVDIKALDNKTNLLFELNRNLRVGYVIFTMGAGYLNNYSTDIIAVIKSLK